MEQLPSADVVDSALSGLAGLKPELAIIVVLIAGVVLLVYLLTRPTKVQSDATLGFSKAHGEIVTQLSEERTLNNTLQDQLGQLRASMNSMQAEIKELQRQKDEEKKEFDQKLKTLQASLDEALKKLDDQTELLKQKEMREVELTRENAALRAEIAAMRKQVADLQFQLNQFLKLPEVYGEESTPSPDL